MRHKELGVLFVDYRYLAPLLFLLFPLIHVYQTHCLFHSLCICHHVWIVKCDIAVMCFIIVDLYNLFGLLKI